MMEFGGMGIIFLVLFWGVVILGCVWLVKSIFSAGQGNIAGLTDTRGSSPREILDLRYAGGEISRSQYETIKQDLQ